MLAIAVRNLKSITLGILASSVLHGVAMAQTVCPKCGRVHMPSLTSSATPVAVPSPTGVTDRVVVAAPAAASPTVTSVPAISPTSYRTNSYSAARPAWSAASTVAGGVTNVLSRLNAQRSRQGVPILASDPSLQAVAARRAQLMASMGTKTHPPGSYAPGTYEGVGWSSGANTATVMACYTSDPNMRAAGAAMARGSDGVYFVVVYR